MACNMRCCAGWENGGCGCVGGCDEPACDRIRDDHGDDYEPLDADDGDDDGQDSGYYW